MRRLPRILLNALTLLSLLLFLATVILWVRSYSIADYLDSINIVDQTGAISTTGLVVFYYRSPIGSVTFDPPHAVAYGTKAPEDVRRHAPSNTLRDLRLFGLPYVSGNNEYWTDRHRVRTG